MRALGVSLLFAVGVWLLYDGLTRPPRPRRETRPGRVELLLKEAGLRGVSPRTYYGVSVGVGLVACLLVQWAFGLAALSLAAALFFGSIPHVLVLQRRDRRRDEFQEALVEAIGQLRYSIRANLSVQQSLANLGHTGPEPLRPYFAALSRNIQLLGFGPALTGLRDELADPLFDTLAVALLVNDSLGGEKLGTVLSGLATSTQKELSIQKEIRAQQVSNVYTQRAITVMPFVLLVGIGQINPEYIAFFRRGAGQALLFGCALWLLFAYYLMKRVTRLPADKRVLR